uniref:Bacterial bifunctional deaminase-reductase C-terminal domain-containing protein n=1 Tax=Fervidicoccus fontis TaxID=683846 RepID=A0A7J3ZL66_9CREN
MQRNQVTVRAIIAITIDGKIADVRGTWRPLCKFELARYNEMLEWADTVIVGARTVAHSNLSFLPKRLKKGFTRIVLDGRLSLKPGYKVFNVENADTVLFTSSNYASIESVAGFEKLGVRVIVLREYPIKASSILSWILRELRASNILIVGGGRTIWTFLSENALHELRVTITPFILGSGQQLLAVDGLSFPGKNLRLEQIGLCACGQEVVLTYRIPPLL